MAWAGASDVKCDLLGKGVAVGEPLSEGFERGGADPHVDRLQT